MAGAFCSSEDFKATSHRSQYLSQLLLKGGTWTAFGLIGIGNNYLQGELRKLL